MEGAGLKEFSYLIALSTAYLLSILLMSTLLYRKSYNKNHIKPIRYSTSIAVFIAALATNPTLLDIGRAFYSNQSGTPSDYIDIKKASLPENPKNLVFIYLESLERTYFNERIFPNLLPELSAGHLEKPPSQHR
jgi:phosphoglycerol transferase